jgi:uncharacterized protein YdhG (YjbR/CyaY superfamily)
MQVDNELVKTRVTVKELDRIKSILTNEVRTELDVIILGLTQVIQKKKNIEPCIRYNLNMVVENGNLLLALFDGIMDESIINN